VFWIALVAQSVLSNVAMQHAALQVFRKTGSYQLETSVAVNATGVTVCTASMGQCSIRHETSFYFIGTWQTQFKILSAHWQTNPTAIQKKCLTVCNF
jgi:hypothetical protein